MLKILSKDEVNKGRQGELDFVRGLAVFFMVLIHLQEYFSGTYAKESLIGKCIDFVGTIPAAPVFMFLLGVGIVYSSKSDWKLMVKRGFLLLLAGYILNFLRGTLPAVFQYYNSFNPDYLQYGLKQLIYVDIFHFAGLSMILFGIIKKFSINSVGLVILMGLFGLANYFLYNISIFEYIPSAVTGLFWGSSDITFFPFLSWSFYPLAGYIWGKFLRRCINKDTFYLFNLVIGSIVISFTVYSFIFILGFENGLSNDFAYYHHKIDSNIIFTSFVVVWISLFYFIGKIVPKFISSHIFRWSRNVSEIYFIHWVLIGFFSVFIMSGLSIAGFLLLFFLIFIISDSLADYYILLKKNSLSQEADTLSKIKNYILFSIITIALIVSAIVYPFYGFQSKDFYALEKLKPDKDVLIFDETDKRYYPAKINSLPGIDRYRITYYISPQESEVVENKDIIPLEIKQGTKIIIDNDDFDLTPGIVTGKSDIGYYCNIDGEIEDIPLKDISILPEDLLITNNKH